MKEMTQAELFSELSKLLEKLGKVTERSARADAMCREYGETVIRKTACSILGVSYGGLKGMIEDGRISTCCDGRRIDTRSIAEYLEAPKQKDFEARFRKRHPGSRFKIVV